MIIATISTFIIDNTNVITFIQEKIGLTFPKIVKSSVQHKSSTASGHSHQRKVIHFITPSSSNMVTHYTHAFIKLMEPNNYLVIFQRSIWLIILIIIILTWKTSSMSLWQVNGRLFVSCCYIRYIGFTLYKIEY